MKYYFYKTTNRINGKYYYGVHSSYTKSGEDSYLGSGTLLQKAIKKYGKDNFKKEILKEFDTLEEAYRWEEEHVTEVEVRDPNCYNVRLGGLGGIGGSVYLHRDRTMTRVPPVLVEQYLQEGWELGMSDDWLQKVHRLELTEEHKQKISKALKGKPSPLRGTHISEEHKQKLSKARKGKSNYWSLGVPRSEETKEKIRQAHLGKKQPQWVIDKIRETKRKKNLPSSTKGKISVWKEGKKQFIYPEELQQYLGLGYFKTKKESTWQR